MAALRGRISTARSPKFGWFVVVNPNVGWSIESNRRLVFANQIQEIV